jgi:hypothetical protein
VLYRSYFRERLFHARKEFEMLEDPVIAEFLATIPPLQSSISIGQDGARIKIDAPESELAEVLKLAAFGREQVLHVRISKEG